MLITTYCVLCILKTKRVIFLWKDISSAAQVICRIKELLEDC